MVGNSQSLTDQVGKSHFVGHGCPLKHHVSSWRLYSQTTASLLASLVFSKSTSESSLTMSTASTTATPPKAIVVAGDICLDVVGIPIPPSADSKEGTDNWRQTGETRTHYLLNHRPRL